MKHSGESTPAELERRSKKPYQAPKILSREKLEALAVFCGGGTGKESAAACPLGPLMS